MEDNSKWLDDIRLNLILFNGEHQLQDAIDTIKYTLETDHIPVYWKLFAIYKGISLGYAFNLSEEWRKKLLDRSFTISQQHEALTRSSEFLVLEAMLACLRMSRAPKIQLPLLSLKVSRLINNAWQLNNLNPRVYLAMALYNSYSPAIAGGSKDVLPNISKSISLLESNPSREPWWGLSESYRILISHLLKSKNRQDAFLYASKAVDAFPENRLFRQIHAQLSTNG